MTTLSASVETEKRHFTFFIPGNTGHVFDMKMQKYRQKPASEINKAVYVTFRKKGKNQGYKQIICL